MSKIAIVTDSTATLTEDLVQQYNIRVAPLSITWDKVKYRDGVDLQPLEFYQRLRKSTTLPTTSGAVQGEFLQIFEELREKVDGIVAIVVTGALSAAYSSAMNAKNMVPEMQIEIIDSRLATMGMGFCVIAAAKTAATGSDMEQIVQATKDIMSKVHVYFAMDTLEYLRRGGRVSLPKAALASFLKVKPIMAFNNGKLEPAAKPRTMPKAIDTLLGFMKEKVTDTPLHVAVMHADNQDGAENLRREITSRFQCAELLITGFSPVIGTHMGPGALSIAFYCE